MSCLSLCNLCFGLFAFEWPLRTGNPIRDGHLGVGDTRRIWHDEYDMCSGGLDANEGDEHLLRF